eukprot:CAMPEP_0171058340 /NCGR_PEP_ID=MMETSP0766_2-20121228/2443_1 /TAXON_ID=439317 /ORGANISM="Gambierdiscus australes, Strain CAWD 149" /LENGTH=305 /DNA_ID=CAMNT_0011513609 /DNA_START=57 /DNA_END=970 /DNA_ORIENTATION=-
MGCGASVQKAPVPQAVVVQPAPKAPGPVAAGVRARAAPKKFQIFLSGAWEDYGDEEDAVLKRAYLVGQPNAKFSLRGHDYEYNFKEMVQRNLASNKERKIRPPQGMPAPKQPLLPSGPMVVIKVPPGSPGTTIEIPDPNNPGRKLGVNVPRSAKVGQKMAVPVPKAGESIESVQDAQAKQQGHSTLLKVAVGAGSVAAVAGLAVGGVILGDHLSGGAVADAAASALGDGAGDAMAAATAFAAGAADDLTGLAADAGGDAAALAGDMATGVGDAAADAGVMDVVDGAADVAMDGVDWLGDAAEDAG